MKGFNFLKRGGGEGPNKNKGNGERKSESKTRQRKLPTVFSVIKKPNLSGLRSGVMRNKMLIALIVIGVVGLFIGIKWSSTPTLLVAGAAILAVVFVVAQSRNEAIDKKASTQPLQLEPFNWKEFFLVKVFLFAKHRWFIRLGRWKDESAWYLSPAVRNPLKPSSDFQPVKVFKWDWTDWVEMLLCVGWLYLVIIWPLNNTFKVYELDYEARITRTVVLYAQVFPYWMIEIIRFFPILLIGINSFDEDPLKIWKIKVETLGYLVIAVLLWAQVFVGYFANNGMSDIVDGVVLFNLSSVDCSPAAIAAVIVLTGQLVVRPVWEVLQKRKSVNLSAAGSSLVPAGAGGTD